ncbi:MAG: hypothetical protein ACLPKB_01740 [Xanthobacteraceae bacterium]
MAFDTSKLGQGGSLPLDEIMPLIDKQPELKREIREAAAKLNKTPEDIICDGMRFPGKWEHLGGSRVSPYICGFGDNGSISLRRFRSPTTGETRSIK